MKVVLPRYKVDKGEAFTYEEERKLVDFCIAHKHLKAVSAILTLLYTGMRSGELKSMTIVNDKYFYIDCITEKTRQGLPDVHRQIPVSPMFKKFCPMWILKSKNLFLQLHRRRFQNVLSKTQIARASIYLYKPL